MPVVTRARSAASAPEWRGTPDPEWHRKALNHTDPITLEPVHAARAVFLQPCDKPGRYHAYDADALARYIETTGTRMSPLTRQRFTRRELEAISRQAGHEAGYLRAAIKFHRWRPLLPSDERVAHAPVEALAELVEVVLQVAREPDGVDMCRVVVAPRIQGVAAAIHACPHLPRVPDVLDALKPALQAMAPGPVRAWVACTLGALHTSYS